MVERFYHQLKAALKAQNNPSSWMDALPLMLLGIQTALKEDISSTAAEMVHKLLQPPYNGPYPVVRRTNKYFTVDITSHKDTVSIDHLKPAHLDVVNDIYFTSSAGDESVPCRVTCFGRRVYCLNTSLSTCHKTLGGSDVVN